MPVLTQNDLIAARSAKRQTLSSRRLSIGNQTTGTPCSLWRASSTSGQIVQPAIPGAGAVPTKATQGAWNFANTAGADVGYIDTLEGQSTSVSRIMFYDRLFHTGNLSGNVTTAQPVNSEAVLIFPLRGSPAVEGEWWLECYADLGITAATANVAVTYTDATTQVLAVAIPGTWRASRLLPIVPAQGKVIQSVQSVTLSVGTGSIGAFGVTCGNRIVGVSIPINVANVPPPAKQAILKQLANDTCLWAVAMCSGANTGDVDFELSVIQG